MAHIDHVRPVRVEHVWHLESSVDAVASYKTMKDDLLQYILPSDADESQAEHYLNIAMNRMLAAIAQTDERLAKLKEETNSNRKGERFLTVINEDDFDDMDDGTKIIEAFLLGLHHSSDLDEGHSEFRHELQRLQEGEVAMLMQWTLWHSAPKLAWGRTDM